LRKLLGGCERGDINTFIIGVWCISYCLQHFCFRIKKEKKWCMESNFGSTKEDLCIKSNNKMGAIGVKACVRILTPLRKPKFLNYIKCLTFPFFNSNPV